MATNSPEPIDILINRAFELFGVKGVTLLMSRMMEGWKKEELNIAVIGNTGAGKSSFINTVRKVKPGDMGAAEVSCTLQTTQIRRYHHPENPNLVYSDLPGVGTPDFPRNTYLQDVTFEQFDFYILVSCTRFTENDLWLASEIKEKGKSFLFLRTKIDQDLDSERIDHPEFTEEQIIRQVKEECILQLKGLAIEEKYLFVISNRRRDLWDFPAALERLVIDFPAIKRESMILICSAETEKLIQMKKRVLRKRAALYALGSALGPVPVVGDVVKRAVIEKEAKFYKEQFGLDDDTVREMGPENYMRASALQYSISITEGPASLGLLMLFQLGDEELIGKSAMKIVQVVGAAAGGLLSYSVCVKTLFDMIDDYSKAAISASVRKLD